MAIFSFNISKELNNQFTVEQDGGTLILGNAEANRVMIKVTQDGEHVALEGSIVAQMLRADGQTLTWSGAIISGTAVVVLPASAYSVQGPAKLNIDLLSNDQRMTLAVLRLMVDATTSNASVAPVDTVPDLATLLTKLVDMEEAADDARQAAAFYPMVYDGVLTFPARKKEYYAIGNWVAGEVIPDKASGQNYHYVLELGGLVEGETFTIKAHNGMTARPWGIIDKDRVAMIWSDDDDAANDLVTVPEGGTGGTLIVQVGNSSISSAKVIRNRNLTSIEERIDHIDDSLDQIAVPFDSGTDYVAGQMVYYNDLLYRFTANHAAGAWTGTDVAQVILSDEVGGIKSEVNVLKSQAIRSYGQVSSSNIETLGTDISDWPQNRIYGIVNVLALQQSIENLPEYTGQYAILIKENALGHEGIYIKYTFMGSNGHVYVAWQINAEADISAWVRLASSDDVTAACAPYAEAILPYGQISISNVGTTGNSVTLWPQNKIYGISNGITSSHVTDLPVYSKYGLLIKESALGSQGIYIRYVYTNADGDTYTAWQLNTTTALSSWKKLLTDADAGDLLAPTESTSAAAYHHAVGDYFCYGGKLYRATAAIPVGGTITPNTNCKLVKLGNDVSFVNYLFGQYNLYHRDTAVDGYWCNTNTGVPFAAEGYFVTDYIPVTVGETYKAFSKPYGTGFNSFRILRYGVDKSYKGYQASTAYTPTAGDAFIRIAALNNVIDTMFVLSTSTMPESYDIDRYFDMSPNTRVPAESVRDVIFSHGNNLFNANDVLHGYRVPTSGYDVIANANYYVSAPIEVEPSATYYIGPFAVGSIVFYTAADVIVSSLSNVSGSFTVPATATRLRFDQAYSSCSNQLERMILSKSPALVRNDDYNIYGLSARKHNRLYSLSDAVWHWSRGEKFPIGFLGDSTTDGAGTSTWTSDNSHEAQDTAAGGWGKVDYINQKAYPYLLQQHIRAELGVDAARVYNIGYTGTYYDWAIPKYDEIFGGVYSDVKMVGLVYGINDRTNYQSQYEFYQMYRNNTIYTINYLRDRGIQPFFVTTQAIVAPYTRTNWPSLTMRTAYHARVIVARVMRELAEEYDMEILDMNGFGEYILKNSDYTVSQIIPDQLHFSDLGNTLEAGYLFSRIYERCVEVTKPCLLSFVDQNVKSQVFENILGAYSGTKKFKMAVNTTKTGTDDTILMDFWVNNMTGEKLTLTAYCYTAGTQYVLVDGASTSITSATQEIGQLECGVHHIVAMSGATTSLNWVGFELT